MEAVKRIIVCDDVALRDRLRKQLVDILILPAAQFSPNGIPAIILSGAQNPIETDHLLSRISWTARAKSIFTARVPLGERVPLQQPAGMALLPWCDDEIFAWWIALLSGSQTQLIFPQWLAVHRFTPPLENFHVEKKLDVIGRHLSCWGSHQLLISNLATTLGCSSRHLQKLLPRLTGIKPGLLLRAIDVLATTAKLMQQEALLVLAKRRGHSPLREMENGFRRRLRRLLGMTYTELLHASQTEHWVAVWMRRWRQVAFARNFA